MKKVALLGLASLLLASAGAQAVSLNGQLGKDYSNLGFGFGTETSGIAVTGNWAHSEDDGEVAGLGLGYTFRWGRSWRLSAVKAFISARIPAATVTPSRSAAACNGKSPAASACSANITTRRIRSPAA